MTDLAPGLADQSTTPPPSPPAAPRFIARFRANWERWTSALGEDQLFLVLAIFIGIFAGLAVVLFRISIEWTQLLVLGPAVHPSAARVLLAPTIAGLIVAVLVIHVFPRVRGSGVNQTKAALYVFDGYIPFSTVIGKFLVCAIAIGSGHSLGPEDPSLQIGAGIASKLGRALRLSREKARLIAPVGAAAGLAAAFNAPISAVLFVIEEVIGNWSGERPRCHRSRGSFERGGHAPIPRHRRALPHPAPSASNTPANSSLTPSWASSVARHQCF